MTDLTSAVLDMVRREHEARPTNPGRLVVLHPSNTPKRLPNGDLFAVSPFGDGRSLIANAGTFSYVLDPLFSRSRIELWGENEDFGVQPHRVMLLIDDGLGELGAGG